MTLHSVLGAKIKCTYGNATAYLAPVSSHMIVEDKLVGTIMNNTPVDLFPTIVHFISCKSPKQPTMKKGIPGPCLPVFLVPWMPGCVSVLVADIPALGQNAKMCCTTFGGQVSFVDAGQTKEDLPI